MQPTQIQVSPGRKTLKMNYKYKPLFLNPAVTISQSSSEEVFVVWLSNVNIIIMIIMCHGAPAWSVSNIFFCIFLSQIFSSASNIFYSLTFKCWSHLSHMSQQVSTWLRSPTQIKSSHQFRFTTSDISPSASQHLLLIIHTSTSEFSLNSARDIFHKT